MINAPYQYTENKKPEKAQKFPYEKVRLVYRVMKLIISYPGQTGQTFHQTY